MGEPYCGGPALGRDEIIKEPVFGKGKDSYNT